MQGTVTADEYVIVVTGELLLPADDARGVVLAGMTAAEEVAMLVEMANDDVTTAVLLAGQFVTVGAQLVMVTSVVDQNVIVEGDATAPDETGETSVDDAAVAGAVDEAAAGVTPDVHAVTIAGLPGTYGAQMPMR